MPDFIELGDLHLSNAWVKLFSFATLKNVKPISGLLYDLCTASICATFLCVNIWEFKMSERFRVLTLGLKLKPAKLLGAFAVLEHCTALIHHILCRNVFHFLHTTHES